MSRRAVLLIHSAHSVCIVCALGGMVENLSKPSKEQLGYSTSAHGREPGRRWQAYLSKAGVRRYSLVTDKMALIRLSVDRGGRLLLVGHLHYQKIFFASNLPGRFRTGDREEVGVGRGSCSHKGGPGHCFHFSLEPGDGGREVGKSSQALTTICTFFPGSSTFLGDSPGFPIARPEDMYPWARALFGMEIDH